MPTIVLPENQQRFLSWLLDPRPEGAAPSDTTKGTQNNMAHQLGLDKSTLSHWKKDPRFVQAWSEQLMEAAGSPATLQAMLGALVEIGRNTKAPAAARVAAVRNYLDVVDKHSPQTVVQVQDPSLLNLDNEELLERTNALLQRTREARRSLGIDGRSMRMPHVRET